MIRTPKAGTDPGRAPQISVYTPRSGEALQTLASVGVGIARRIEDERLAREAEETQIAFTRDMQNLRLEASQIGDPDQLEAYWSDRMGALRTQYVEGASPRLKQRIGTGIDRLANQFTVDVGRTVIAARQSQQRARWDQYSHVTTQTYASASDEAKEVLREEAFAFVDGMLERGAITAEQQQQFKQEFVGSATNAAAIRDMAENPTSFIEGLEAGRYTDLDAETQARYRATAEAAAAREAAAQEKTAEQEAAARERVIGDELTEMREIWEAGGTPVNIERLDDPAYKASPEYARTMAAQSLFRQEPLISQMSTDELDELIAAEKGRPKTYKWQLERLELLEEWRDANAKEFAQDGIAAGRDRGYQVSELPAFDPSNPRDYIVGVRSRLNVSDQLERDGHTNGTLIFDAAEAAELGETMGPGGDPQARAAWIMSMSAALKDKAPAVIRQVTQDPTTAYAATLLNNGATPAVVSSMLSGQRRVADKTVTLPSHAEFVTAWDEATEGEFRGQYDLTPQLMTAATYLYAEAGGDPEDIDGKLFERSVQQALGATSLTSGGDITVGGLQEFDAPGLFGGSYRVDLPVGMPRDDVRAALEVIYDGFNAEARNQATRDGRVGGEARPSRSLALLERLSQSGKPPSLGSDPEAIWKNVSDLRLASVWRDGQPTGTYTFYRLDGNGATVPLTDTDGRLFKFRLTDMVKETLR